MGMFASNFSSMQSKYRAVTFHHFDSEGTIDGNL